MYEKYLFGKLLSNCAVCFVRLIIFGHKQNVALAVKMHQMIVSTAATPASQIELVASNPALKGLHDNLQVTKGFSDVRECP